MGQVEQQYQKALEEDPTAFDYDGVYDEMKGNQVRPIHEDRAKREVGATLFDFFSVNFFRWKGYFLFMGLCLVFVLNEFVMCECSLSILENC